MNLTMSILFFRRPLPLIFRYKLTSIRRQSQKATDEKVLQEEPGDEQPKYSESDAHLKWKSRNNYFPEENPYPKSLRPIMLASLGSFMIYFFVLREENDIDELIYQPIWKTVPELEIPMFQLAVKQHRDHNAPYADLEAHLKQALERREREQQLLAQNNQSGGGVGN